MDKKKIAKLAAKVIMADGSTKIKDGDKVRLNINRIQNYKQYSTLADKNKLWIKAHRTDIFTVEIDAAQKVICTFKEDETKPKWKFWLGDLIKI